MAAMLNSAIFKSAILHSAILHKTLTQTNSIWLKVIHSHSTWWWEPSWTLPYWIQPFCTKKTSLIHSLSTWWWQPCWILSSWIQPFCTKHWLKLIQSDSNWFIFSQLDDGSHLELCHLGFTHFAQNSDSNYFNLTQTHSFSLNLMMAAILNSAILNSAMLDSTILVFLLKLTHTCQLN